MSIVLTTKSGPDSKLHLEIPVNQPEAEFEVEINVRSARHSNELLSAKDWASTVQALAGSISDPRFERPAQLSLEERERLS